MVFTLFILPGEACFETVNTFVPNMTSISSQQHWVPANTCEIHPYYILGLIYILFSDPCTGTHTGFIHVSSSNAVNAQRAPTQKLGPFVRLITKTLHNIFIIYWEMSHYTDENVISRFKWQTNPCLIVGIMITSWCQWISLNKEEKVIILAHYCWLN